MQNEGPMACLSFPALFSPLVPISAPAVTSLGPAGFLQATLPGSGLDGKFKEVALPLWAEDSRWGGHSQGLVFSAAILL